MLAGSVELAGQIRISIFGLAARSEPISCQNRIEKSLRGSVELDQAQEASPLPSECSASTPATIPKDLREQISRETPISHSVSDFLKNVRFSVRISRGRGWTGADHSGARADRATSLRWSLWMPRAGPSTILLYLEGRSLVARELNVRSDI